ncbi:MAG: PIG-L family deacetylase [Chloroflexi bacterium]|nr:PIG-L family deacetylase [Chloroflexota bacterium]
MARYLAISAHPDDETLFAGGYLARRAAEGHAVYLLLTTRGEGGEVGEPPVGPRERLGEFREQEMRHAAAALGAAWLDFLPFVDPHMEIGGEARAIEASLDEFSAHVARHLERLRPDVVLTHGSGGEYGHPQHVYTHQATMAALERLDGWQPQQVLTWMANVGANAEDRLTNRADQADEVLDLAGTAWFEAKVRAALCHRSQHAMFLRNSGKPSVREMVRTLEAFKEWRVVSGERLG